MAEIHFQIVPIVLPPEAEAVYSSEDYALTVGPSGNLLPGMNRLTLDSLTLSFRPSDHKFVGLDAYTNSRLWKRFELVLPETQLNAELVCVEAFDENGIVAGNDGPAEYTYHEEGKVLRINVQKIAPNIVRYVRVLSCVRCGLGPDGELAELWIENLRPDRA